MSNTPDTAAITKVNQIMAAGAGGFLAESQDKCCAGQGSTNIREIELIPTLEWYQRIPGEASLSLDLICFEHYSPAFEGVVESKNLTADRGGKAFTAGWIDQPVSSQGNPNLPGTTDKASLAQKTHFQDCSGMGFCTRKVISNTWDVQVPRVNSPEIVTEIITAENKGQPDSLGSQDIAGNLYTPNIRLDYDINHYGEFITAHLESNTDPGDAHSNMRAKEK